jgi:hypothetical protein
LGEEAPVCEEASAWDEAPLSGRRLCAEDASGTEDGLDCAEEPAEEAGIMEEACELPLPSPPHAVKAKITAAASRNKSIFFKNISPFSAAVWGKTRN